MIELCKDAPAPDYARAIREMPPLVNRLKRLPEETPATAVREPATNGTDAGTGATFSPLLTDGDW